MSWSSPPSSSIVLASRSWVSGRGGGQALDAAVDARGLEDADHDRERPLAVHLLEEDDLLLVVLVDDDPRKFHLHGHGGRLPLVRRARGSDASASARSARGSAGGRDGRLSRSMIRGRARRRQRGRRRSGVAPQPSPSKRQRPPRAGPAARPPWPAAARRPRPGRRLTNASLLSFARMRASCRSRSASALRCRAASASLSIRPSSGRMISTSGQDRDGAARPAGRPRSTIVTDSAGVIRLRMNASPWRSRVGDVSPAATMIGRDLRRPSGRSARPGGCAGP